ncbi:phosphoribosyltransferase family protein [Helicobacter sp. 11S03491-1]|uniref:phosphoribosyltransferase n=1 Tax=Helicobacter sp. 11S03491-1 TaxID=1476196 RepID=UPI000BA701F6|nr:phosphoribosyltransferase family protein [Helicobacter sp. 11S03491-1]PAF42948.1 nicotinate phosphoribosyltransferase [Helicobacter sp. 11S03491-1]
MYYSYHEFLDDLKSLRAKIEEKIGIPDGIVCIARGGMVMSHMLSLAWNLRAVYTLNAISYNNCNVQHSLVIENIPSIKPEHQKILVIDEIIDSGNSLEIILQKLQFAYKEKSFWTGVIFQKPTAKVFADFFIKNPPEWIDFFWEVDMLKENS